MRSTYGERILAPSCTGASSVFARERHPASNPPYFRRASVPPASLREDPTSPHILDTQTEIKASGVPDACSRRLRDEEPIKMKMEHRMGKWRKPSTSFADGAEGRKPRGGGGRRRESVRSLRPWAARYTGGLNTDLEFRTLGDIPKRKSSLPTHP
ncbi:hypothetical protein DFH08DRAFT_53932 [Mycena albidolilacea]|uniref:Uncharacterized protein n=1 Tax=Mycena albidolilacea TaxID=1033008 RepID=A0AAD6Z1Y4_9AGAR|nr:hypothetical protein DFH08DRAFT_53932 [Mycena albidolilacea]